MMHFPVVASLVVLLTTSWGLCSQAKTKSRGEISVSSRTFIPDDDEYTKDWGLSTDARLEFKAKQSGGFRQEVRILGRAAAHDEQRSSVILEEAWAGWKGEHVEMLLGARLINWSATEAFHPADIINSRNLDSNIENAEKIGEPMASVRLRFGQGGLSAFFMPLRQAPRLPGPRSRLSLSQGQVVGQALWADRTGHLGTGLWASQWAVRVDQTFGGLDVALHFVDHQDRGQPAVVFDASNGEVHPVYRRVQRVGGTLAYVVGEWLVKAEIDHRWFDALSPPDSYQVVSPGAGNHTAAAVGVEWGWGYASGAEGTVLAEGQWAIAPEVPDDERVALGPFQRDVLVGYRHTWNDVDGTEFLLGVIMDTERSDEAIVNLTFSRRLNDQWGVQSALRVIHAPDAGSALHSQHEAHSFQFDLKRSF